MCVGTLQGAASWARLDYLGRSRGCVGVDPTALAPGRARSGSNRPQMPHNMLGDRFRSPTLAAMHRTDHANLAEEIDFVGSHAKDLSRYVGRGIARQKHGQWRDFPLGHWLDEHRGTTGRIVAQSHQECSASHFEAQNECTGRHCSMQHPLLNESSTYSPHSDVLRSWGR